MKRKILSLILVFAMTVSLLTVGTGAVEPTYGDTAGHWAESSIERWSAYGIIQGSNGQFDPNGQLTCAQLATILAKLLKLPAAKDAGFTDNTADAWYYDAINRCAAAGILNGNGDGTVTPEAPITRERAMVMLARALGIEPIRKPDLTKYTDAAQVSAYAQGYVAALIEAGIVGGVTADELAPQANINRASTVTILDRAISTYADKAGATVKADGKGIVLVVAKNVKITNAPEGTKIVVADGATGLTVNGKSVSDDQTYIVPKTTPGSGSSSGGSSLSHNYDENNYCAGCGQFKDTVVAAIGTKGYETLAEAVAAVEDNGTIKLLKSSTGSGIGTYKTPKKDVNGNDQIEAKGFTIDFNGFTYSVDRPAVGSEGYETQGFHLEWKGDSTPNITLKNGTLKAAEQHDPNLKLLIQNYCNLTLDNMTVDGTNLTKGWASNGVGFTYVTSNCNGIVTIKDTTIISENPDRDVAFDVDGKKGSYGPVKLTISGNSDIRGKFEVANRDGNSLSISGGTFSNDPTQYLAAGYVATETSSGIWTVGEAPNKTFVAQVGNGKYETLAEAISAVQEGNTIKMLKDVDNAAGISVNTGKTFTIDFDGHTYKVNKPGAGSTGTETAAFQLIKDQTITFKNGTICADADNLQEATAPAKNILRFFQSYANVNFVDMTIDGTNIRGNNSVIEFANGNVSITGSTSITAKPGAKAINVDTWKIDSYSGGAHVTINTTGSIGDIYLYSEGNKTGGFTKSTLNISGGIFGSVTGDENKEYTAAITGGTFSSNPSAYVAEGYIARTNNDGKYVVSMVGTEENPYTLDEFNALTSIPAAAEKVYVNLGNASLQDGLTIGNEKIADRYRYGEPNSTTAPEGFPHDTGRTDNDTRHIYSTGKSAVNIILTGSVTGATDTGNFNAGGITLKVPDAANVIFDKVTFGEGQMAMSMWTESQVQSMTVSHRLASVTFNGCTFKGNWLQNGAFGADEMTITGCTFEKYENTAGTNSDGFDCTNNSNPIWIQNMGQTNVTIEGCTINAVRPIKLWENDVSGTAVIKDNVFDMSKCSIDNDSTHKNIAVMFSTINWSLGNVEISGNTVKGDATALVCFGDASKVKMAEGATFKISNNKLADGVKALVKWKTSTEITDFSIVTE